MYIAYVLKVVPKLDGQTALGVAALHKDWQIVTSLMDAKTDLNAPIHGG
jgi:hypothetical protein